MDGIVNACFEESVDILIINPICERKFTLRKFTYTQKAGQFTLRDSYQQEKRQSVVQTPGVFLLARSARKTAQVRTC